MTTSKGDLRRRMPGCAATLLSLALLLALPISAWAQTVAVRLDRNQVTVPEDGSRSASYGVALTREPTTSRTVTISTSTDSTDAAVLLNTQTLTFTKDNWSEYQTVTVTGVDDDVDSDRTETLSNALDPGTIVAVKIPLVRCK